MLIDMSGRIIFKGHPAGRNDLEGDLTKLANGEELTGEGIVNGPVAGDAEKKADEVPEGFKEMDLSVVDKEIAAFKTVCSGFQKDKELQKVAKGMQRSFCVIVLQTAFDPKTGKSLSKYENYRVLVGKQESIDKLSAAFQAVQGTFEINK